MPRLTRSTRSNRSRQIKSRRSLRSKRTRKQNRSQRRRSRKQIRSKNIRRNKIGGSNRLGVEYEEPIFQSVGEAHLASCEKQLKECTDRCPKKGVRSRKHTGAVKIRKPPQPPQEEEESVYVDPKTLLFPQSGPVPVRNTNQNVVYAEVNHSKA